MTFSIEPHLSSGKYTEKSEEYTGPSTEKEIARCIVLARIPGSV